MHVYVDQDICTGCGVCPTLCPDVFTMSPTGVAETLVEEVPGDMEDQCSDAADRCPVEAIALEEL